MKPAYDAVVVGSGYGGGVAASRLARMGFKVAVLELGRHWRPGDFPTTAKARRKTARLAGRAPKLGDPAGLYYLSVGHGLTVFGASGLGGGSLINAGVALRPEFERLRTWGWPKEVLDDGLLVEGLATGETMLGVAPVPQPERFNKFAGMSRLAAASGLKAQTPRMHIAQQPGVNPAGVLQYGCQWCGDCWSGCNAGAKITTANTYIADAVDHGAEVFCEARVQAVMKTNRGWALEVKDLSVAGVVRRLEAGIVVLSAGTLGTVELLLRAKARGLSLSDRLGQAFSANGDDLVIASDWDQPVNAVATGFPSQAPKGVPQVGTHSISVIDLGDEDGPVWAHDGTMLRMMASLAPLNDLVQLNARTAYKIWREGMYGHEMSRTQLIYIVAHDDASGQLRLQNDHVVVDWPGYSGAALRLRAERKVRDLIEKAGGEFGDNPFALGIWGGNRIIAHPLGGAGMGETAATGVIAHDGRVFDPSNGPTAVHDGLYVCDGAMAPASVGVSPLLTITALTERVMTLASRQLNRALDRTQGSTRPIRDALL